MKGEWGGNKRKEREEEGERLTDEKRKGWRGREKEMKTEREGLKEGKKKEEKRKREERVGMRN